MTLRPCLDCGEPSDAARCPDHTVHRTHARSAHQRGYDAAWRRLSAQARRLQGYCTDCGSREDLTTDHSPEAWEAKARGRRITLAMVDVVCRSCNGRRGKARPDERHAASVLDDRGTNPPPKAPGPLGKPQGQLRYMTRHLGGSS